MKPVMSKTFGKNGDVIENFAPTAKQILFALSKAQNPTLSDNEILDNLGIHRNSLYQWKTKYGHKFTEFVEEMIDSHAPDKGAELLEAVGMVEALQGSFNHWKEMSKIKGLIKDESSTTKITINTNFEHVSLGGNFDEQRARLLSELRGVGKSGKPRVAEPVTIDVTPSREGERNRTRKVQV